MNDIAERIGIYAAGRISAQLPGVIFREQQGGDTGINAHLEIMEDYPRLGKSIGLQIRSDESTRLERTARGYLCRGEMSHLAYWFQHSIPVLVMIYEQKNERILWEFVSADTVEIEGSSWELVVPHDHVYGPETVSVIAELPCYSPYLSRLALDRPWMELIGAGRKVTLEMDEWINRPSARGTLRLCVGGADGHRDSVYEWAFQTDADMPHAFRLPALFPWADLAAEEEFYRAKETHPFPDPAPIRPWTVEAGEIARFLLRFSLNELGKSFLTTERFLRRGEFPGASAGGRTGDAYESSIKFRLHRKY